VHGSTKRRGTRAGRNDGSCYVVTFSVTSRSPQKQRIDTLKGSFDISDCSEIKTDMDPEDEPQIGKYKTCFKMKIDNTGSFIIILIIR
jgi:hypothetical protein